MGETGGPGETGCTRRKQSSRVWLASTWMQPKANGQWAATLTMRGAAGHGVNHTQSTHHALARQRSTVPAAADAVTARVRLALAPPARCGQYSKPTALHMQCNRPLRIDCVRLIERGVDLDTVHLRSLHTTLACVPANRRD